MIILRKVEDIREFLEKRKKSGQNTAFIPTMGALHAGHISLLNSAKSEGHYTICSIFVNPTQFNNQQDFAKYPKTIEQDIYALEHAGCDLLFLPSTEEMYPNGQKSTLQYDLGYLETILEGKYRPGHFQGVCQIVHRLLDIVPTDYLYLGQKDYQQCMVVQKLIELLDIKTTLVICPTQREASGLAMSSRNMRLNDTEKKQAAKIYETLSHIKKALKAGELNEIKETATQKLIDAGFTVDYVEIAESSSLKIINNWDGHMPLVALVAAYLNEVRLIDNLLITN
ncbi:pantoate--beta-alanine ligase [Ferruginibacter sp. SUN002]|uniref:pantoate--beta-alanine ligase n=1 Tax=Ferruginibacter sp. SUN002 TaxID=2937789 RepID=UPI003D366273